MENYLREQNYVVYHLHSDLSNAVTTIDSVTKYKDYINKAKAFGMKAIAFSEHGTTLEWLHKKEYIEKCGMKYLHAVEVYVTESTENKLRDNYHVVLIARNLDGFKEINTLVSKSFNRSETKVIDDVERFYYQPRVTFEDLINTSDNVLMTTACLGGILGQSSNIQADFIKFLTDNKHRCFLEVQHHSVADQINYNKRLYQLSLKTGIPLIAGTDTHSLNEEYAEGRIILQRAKNIYFENEEGWDLTFKSYAELLECYKKQNSLPEQVYLDAIDNTNKLADMVEEIKIDKSNKYPEFSKCPAKDIKDLIYEGIKWRNVELTESLKVRINNEFKVFQDNGALNFLMLEYDIKKWARENRIGYGVSRGSVSGSYICYLLGITDADSIEYNLNFERFMNSERVSLADVDTDWEPSKRQLVKDYLYTSVKYHCAEIVTFNTVQDKGVVNEIGRALGLDLDAVNMIKDTYMSIKNRYLALFNDMSKAEELKDIDLFSYETHMKQLLDMYNNNTTEIEEKLVTLTAINDEFIVLSNSTKDTKKLFKYFKMIKGVIVSIGSHPAATICSPVTLEDNIGTLTLKTNTHPVVVLNMKEIDSLNFVKLDLLGLANVEIINKTCDLIGIERITADKIDYKDNAVWAEIMKHPIGMFQFESDFAHGYIKDIFRPEVLEKIKARNPDLNYLDLMSMANGAIRPAGKSYRAALANGEFNDNGHEALNNFLASTNGFLVYQEQIIEFLHSFCGFSMGKADIVRRGFAKKTGTDQFIPDIKAGFIKTMLEKYGVSEHESEELIIQFLKVIEDASSYLFSYNHALPYSTIGYTTGWLRHYYPLEFLCTLLEINKDDQVKTSDILEFIRQHTEIKVKPIRFRYSTSEYNIDKSTNMIYKGMQSIKYLSEKISSELYALRGNNYDNFIDVLIDLKENTSCDSRQTQILIKLDFFSEFGKNKRLLKIYNLFELIYGKTQLKKEKAIELGFDLDLIDKLSRSTAKTYMDFQSKEFLYEIIKTIPDDSISLSEQLIAEIEYLGRAIGRYNVPDDYMIICDMELKATKKTNKKYATAHLYGLKDGNMITANIWGTQLFTTPTSDNPETIQLLHTYDIICANLKHDENGWCDTVKSFVMLQKYDPDSKTVQEEVLQ